MDSGDKSCARGMDGVDASEHSDSSDDFLTDENKKEF